MLRQTTAVAVALAVVLAGVATISLAAAATAAGSSEVVDVDANWGLTADDAISRYETSGVATATGIGGHGFQATIAADSSDVPLDGFRVDSQTTYLHVAYTEDIPRTYRLYVPADYWRPRVKEDLAAEDAPVTMDLRPTDDHEWTVVSISFDGPTNATWAVGKQAGWVFSSRHYVSEKVNNTTGISAPSFGTSDPGDDWQYLDSASLSGANTTEPVATGGEPVMLQYDTSEPHEQRRWVAVPECSRQTEPVCYFRKDGVDGRVYVMSPVENPPQVRHKRGTDRKSGLLGGFNKLRDAAGTFVDDLSGLFGGS